MKIKNVKRIAGLKDSRDINKIGAWLDSNGLFENNLLLKVIWYIFSIKSTLIQIMLFGICYLKVLFVEQYDIADDKEVFMSWGKEVVCKPRVQLTHSFLLLSILVL